MAHWRTSLGALIILPQLAAGQTEYTADGTPTARSEEIRWHMNRARFNPAAENTLRGTGYGGLVSRPALAPHNSLTTASTYHSIDMATQNVFQHETVTNSAYFNWQAHHATTGNTAAEIDFSERAIALGYTMSAGAENITAGNGSALNAYLSWWNSSGHRANMMNDYRETGIGGSPRVGSSTYSDYDTMLLARRNAATGFFTDTLFRDINSNTVYNDGEGVGGLRIELTNNGAAHASYDISTGVGSFAIPLDGIATGNTVQVLIASTGAAAVTISVPSNFSTLNSIVLSAGQRWRIGTFVRAANTNAGFRNLTFNPAPTVTAPAVSVSTATGAAVISWPSLAGHTYQVQWSATLSPPWTNLHSPALAGNGATLSVTDPSGISGNRFYRVVATTP